jgi:hypothetical protein
MRFLRHGLTMVIVAICGSALAQEPGAAIKSQLFGVWELTSNTDKNSDGSSKWGENPKGSLIFESNGRYSFTIVRSDLKKFALNSADKGTPDENASVVRGSFANFGTYTVDEAAKTFTTKVDASIYPNITGASITRNVLSLADGELRYSNAATATGASAVAVWRKIKP